MKHCILQLAISIALSSFAFGQSSPQQNSENSKSEQEVKQMSEKFHSALVQADIPILQKIWADDYLFVTASGEVLTKDERLRNIKSGATKLEAINEEEDVKVRVYQNSAVETHRVTIKGKYGGQSTSDQYRSTSVWVNSPEGWQLVSTQLTAVTPK